MTLTRPILSGTSEEHQLSRYEALRSLNQMLLHAVTTGECPASIVAADDDVVLPFRLVAFVPHAKDVSMPVGRIQTWRMFIVITPQIFPILRISAGYLPGHLASAILVHAFCNWMGVPDLTFSVAPGNIRESTATSALHRYRAGESLCLPLKKVNYPAFKPNFINVPGSKSLSLTSSIS